MAQAVAPMAGAFVISAMGEGATLYLLAALGTLNVALTWAMWHSTRHPLNT
ncbi:hypothetical protein [Roseinatronobacter bogoriensis]|nr:MULTISPECIES: hypothetical protein [Rhodobaca]TDW41687.1 hypothetical protein LY39_00795 [Rhodobaca barguzinensis]TDY74134.1 hypothetical protein EV660_101169 [Rhodobaca bogoriensis DSM 18756]